jgi:hypothetical protein
MSIECHFNYILRGNGWFDADHKAHTASIANQAAIGNLRIQAFKNGQADDVCSIPKLIGTQGVNDGAGCSATDGIATVGRPVVTCNEQIACAPSGHASANGQPVPKALRGGYYVGGDPQALKDIEGTASPVPRLHLIKTE